MRLDASLPGNQRRWPGGGRSLAELPVGAVSVVDEQLARGELFSVGGLVLPEPVHYLLSAVQIHEAEGPWKDEQETTK